MDSKGGFLGSFLSKGIKTNQLEVNTDEKTLRPIARLKEPRELFALPKEKDYDCAQQAPRWPIECQVIEERVILIPNVPAIPEPYYQRTGNELKPRPVGEENGIIVYNYNPISAVNYDKERQSSNKDNDNNDDDDSSDSDASSCDSRGSTTKLPVSTSITTTKNFANMLNRLESRLSYATKDDDVSDVDDDDEGDDESDNSDMNDEKITEKFNDDNNRVNKEQNQVMASNLDNIWASKSPEYVAVRSLYHSKIQLTKPNTNARTKLKKPSAADCKKLRMIPPMNFNDKLLSKLDLKNVSSSSSSTSTNSDDLTDDGEVDGEEDHIYQVNEQLAIANHPALTTTIQLPNAKSNKILNPNILHPNSTSISNLNHSVPASNAIPLIAILPGETLISDPKVPFVLSRLSRADDNWSNEPSNSAPTTTTTTNNSNNNNSNNSAQDNVGNAQENIKPSHLPQFSRSAANGSKVPTNCHPYNPAEYDGLEFESRFESGNLAKAVQITPTYYELYLRPDLYTSRSKQWFFFRVRRTKRNMIYRFSIVNLVKSNSLYNDGMRPLMYSTTDAKITGVGWKRCGDNICYYCNEDESQISTDEEFDNSSYTLTFNVEFAHDNDIVYFAHSYPYTYSDLQDYLMAIQNDPLKSKFCKLRLLCRTLAGNNVYYLTVTAPTTSDEVYRRKKSIVLSARVHPSETPSSWMMKGVMDFITADTATAKRLRHRFVFKIIPMLNPDGVIVGNTRNSLTGKDLNRQYRTVIRETYPSIWYTKALIKRLIDENGVSMYCDMHAHSRCHNIFIYGCENKRNPEKKLTEQVFPLMLHKNAAEKFSFENCKFKIQRSKEGTGRIVVWMLGITNSYTLEASFGGSTLGSRKGTHFNIMDYEQMGRAFCETLLDYSDDNPIKVKKQAKIIKHIRKIRKREKREQKALKLKKLCDQQCLRLKIIERLLKEGSSAEEPINITLTDYSSDEGSCLSSDEGKSFSDLEGPCCLAIKAPPCTPDIQGDTMRTCDKQRIFKFRRMRKVMKELDRIYFQPLFHKKARFLMKSKRTTCKTKSKRKGKKSDKNHKDFKTNSPHNKHNNNNNNTNTDKGKTKIPSFDSGDATTINNGHFANDINAIEYLEDGETSTNNNNESENTTVATDETTMPKQRLKGGRDAKNSSKRKTRIKVSRKLRLWLATRQIIIVRRRTPRKIKLHWKGMRILRTTTKKDDRRILDIPTTDPGSDLIFSTDDEFIVDNSNMSPTYNTLPRIRRNLLQSDLQRRYIEEIGDGFRRMPPELIITSPINELRVKYKLMPEAKLKATNTPGIIIGEGATRRTLSWHNLQTESAAQFTKCKLHSNTLHVLDTKKESLTKEDLNIQLLLKKKTWTGTHITDLNNQNTLDRAKASVRLVTSAKTDSKAITASSQTYHTESLENAGTKMTNNTTQDKSSSTPETDFFARNCSRKLLQWQLTNSSKQNVETTEFRRHRRSPLQTAINDSTDFSMTPMFRQIITNNQKAIKNNDKTILENYGNERKTRIKRNFPTKNYGGVKNLLKLTKSKSHTSMLSAIGIDSKGRLPHIRACSSSKLKMSITRIVAIDSKNNSNKISLNRCKNKNNNNSNKKIRKQAPAMQQRTKDNETTINTSKQTSTYKEVATISGAASNSIKQQNYNNNNSNNNNNAFVEGTATTTATQLMRKSKMKVKKRKLPPLLNNSATPINLVNNFDNNL